MAQPDARIRADPLFAEFYHKGIPHSHFSCVLSFPLPQKLKEKGGKNISHCHFFLHTFFSILFNRLASLWCQSSPALSLRARGNWHFRLQTKKREDAHGIAVGCILISQGIKKPSKMSNPTVTKSNTITISPVRKTIYLSHEALKTEPNIPRVVQ